ncbi:MAG: DUF4190 domain-containing protein, partial [Cryobacterium sp.]
MSDDHQTTPQQAGAQQPGQRSAAGPATPEGYATPPRTNTLAVVSLVSAFVFSLVAIVTGHIALGQIRARGEAGRGLAIAGLVLGYLGAAVLASLIALAVLFAAVFGSVVSSLG